MAQDTANQAHQARTPVNKGQGANGTAQTCTPRAAKGQVTTKHTPRVGRMGATQPTHRASSRGGTRRPLVRAWPGCIKDNGKRHSEPWKQPVTGEPVHSPGGCRGEAIVPQTRGSNTPGGERYSKRLDSPPELPPKGGACGHTHGHM